MQWVLGLCMMLGAQLMCTPYEKEGLIMPSFDTEKGCTSFVDKHVTNANATLKIRCMAQDKPK